MSTTGPASATSWQPSELQRRREAYRRARTRRSWLIAVLSSAAVLAVVVLTVRRSSGWPSTRNSFFALHTGVQDLPELIKALWINVQIMLISEVLILVLAALLAILRTLPGPVFFPLRLLATAYVDIFRGLPVLIVLFLVAFGIPSLRLQGAPNSAFVLCIVALTLTYSAYVAEVFRAGIESVHPSQRASARALGLTYGQSMRYVVMPQAVRSVLPPLLNDFVSLQKDTSLVSTVGVIDMVLTAENLQSQDFKFVHMVFAGLIFVALTIPLTRFTDYVARRRGWVNSGAML